MKTKMTMLFIIFTMLISSSAMSAGKKRVYVKIAPPASKQVVVVKPVKPVPNAVWVAGHWQWNGNKYVWVDGSWKEPRKGYVWIPGHWNKTARGWFWVEGHWKRK